MTCRPTRLRIAVLALAGVGLVVAGCSRKDDTAASTTTSPSTTSSSTTTEPLTSRCDAITKPAGASRQTTAQADVDGDGTPDDVRAFLIGDAEWHLQVTLAAGGGADLSLVTFDPGSVAVLGGADLDGDGTDEIWARTGSGASAAILGLVHYAECALTRVTFAGGGPAELAVGGSVGTASGVACGGTSDPSASVTAYTASNTGDNEYQVTATEYALVGGTVLEQRASTSSTVSTDDPLFERATTFTCGDLRL